MIGRRFKIGVLLLLAAGAAGWAFVDAGETRAPLPEGRREVVFWHFWGGKDRAVVEEVVRRFNASQNEHFVRAIAMPGANLDLKFFLSVAGGSPPDLLNQDDPVVGDWASRGVLKPLAELASPAELAALEMWLYPAARELGSFEGRLYALCNGLDLRALYYDATMLKKFQLDPPKTLNDLDHIAHTIAPPDALTPPRQYGYLPDPRRLWAWGIVFGGEFYDPANGKILADSPPIVAALEWMASHSKAYGSDRVAAFRKGDQALSGSAFPLLQGRYAVIMDGQWRVAEIAAAQAEARRRGETPHEFGVAPLPPPPGGRENAGWVNGNFFVVPRGARNPAGAWAFMKFWSGFGGQEAAAAETCAAGGWIPASAAVVREPRFQQYLDEHPLFRTFVELAASPNQRPTPAVPFAMQFYNEIVRAAEDAMYRGLPAREVLREARERLQAAGYRLQAKP